MIGGTGYDVSKYGKPGLTDSDIYWMDIDHQQDGTSSTHYFWKVLMKPDSVMF